MNKFYVFLRRNYGLNRSDRSDLIGILIMLIYGGYKHWLVWLAFVMVLHQYSAYKLCREDLRAHFRKVYDGFVSSIILYFCINMLIQFVTNWIDHKSIF